MLFRSGWVDLSDGRYYFGDDGIMYMGWHDIDGKKYFFSKISGNLVTNEIVGEYNLTEDGSAVPLSDVQNRAKVIVAAAGNDPANIYNWVRSHNSYNSIAINRDLAQIEEIGWAYFANYALDNKNVVCYCMAAVTDLLFKQAGYNTRIVCGSIQGKGAHYWNQVYINGQWLNYDLSMGYYAVSMAYLKSYKYTVTQYVSAKYY